MGIPEKEEKIEEKEEKIEEKNAEKEGNMEKMKGAISEILRNLTNFETEAALQFHQENMTIENEEKLMKSLGKKLNKIVKFARHLHLKFNHYLKEKDGKIIKEVIEAIHEKFHGMKDRFEIIEKMGDEKEAELRKRKPDAKVHSFVQILHKKNQTIPEKEEKIEEKNSEKEGNMEKMKGAISEILRNLTNFEKEA